MSFHNKDIISWQYTMNRISYCISSVLDNISSSGCEGILRLWKLLLMFLDESFTSSKCLILQDDFFDILYWYVLDWLAVSEQLPNVLCIWMWKYFWCYVQMMSCKLCTVSVLFMQLLFMLIFGGWHVIVTWGDTTINQEAMGVSSYYHKIFYPDAPLPIKEIWILLIHVQ